MKTKTCTKCGEVKALDAFGRKGNSCALRTRCKACEYAAVKEWGRKNIERVRIIKANASRKERKESPEICRSRNSAWYSSHTEQIKNNRAKNINDISPSYAATKMRMKVSECPPELIALKREQLQIYRITKQLNQAIKESQK